MEANRLGDDETLTATVALTLSGVRVEAEITVPTRPVELHDLLPILHSLADTLVEVAVIQDARAGYAVSCSAGCGACCRQLVPVTEPEAIRLYQVIQALPGPRRLAVLDRFADAQERLSAAGLWDTLTDPERFNTLDLEPSALGLPYFAVGLACPFLDDERCSIHPERPLACREYLVSSPPAHCASLSAEGLRGVPLPARLSSAVHRLTQGSEDSGATVPSGRWIPLVAVPEWVESHPTGQPLRPGPAWIGDLFSNLTGQDVPPAPDPSG